MASACFRWPELSKQVRITGKVSKVSPAETEFLFRSEKIKNFLIFANGFWICRRCSNVEQTNFFTFAKGKDHIYNQSNVVENK